MMPPLLLLSLYLASPALGQGELKNIEPDIFEPGELHSPHSYPSPNATGSPNDPLRLCQAILVHLALDFLLELLLPQRGPKLIRARAYAIIASAIALLLQTGLNRKEAMPSWDLSLQQVALSRGGTNFEGYETVIGHQAAGVQAVPKQSLGYDGQQYNRTFYSSNINDKTLHEVEVWPYAEAVRARAACVMTSYLYVNNSQASQNAHLINDVLKTHLSFQGYTQTDWFALKSGVHAILAGQDQAMPRIPASGLTWSYFGANYTRVINNGSAPAWRLDDAATRIMTPSFHLSQDRNFLDINLVAP
ncbi:hypothetical protein GMDG_07078 [Pseudogymnoascus destructans 20631-21]|uniref:beta-glucosidase n=1 Tax=Pseudogymnoascus destructans (strain ATCC MYA-4855 / 20631-21) TaxID=658429 RepID=L8FWJ1_PSED2|nr:hypothetical protein GMDG_07078 [Pseudogymnoascus destructans 20631-21]